MSEPTVVTFHLANGIVFNPSAPLHLDALVNAQLYFQSGAQTAHYNRDTIIPPSEEQPLPIASTTINGVPVYLASALLPVGQVFAGQSFWRRSFKYRDAEVLNIAGNVNYTTGQHRTYFTQHEVQIVPALAACFVAKPSRIKQLLNKLKYLGSQRRMGYGLIREITYSPAKTDWSLSRRNDDGTRTATRYYPHPHALHRIRPRPPYWNASNRTPVLLPGEVIPA